MDVATVDRYSVQSSKDGREDRELVVGVPPQIRLGLTFDERPRVGRFRLVVRHAARVVRALYRARSFKTYRWAPAGTVSSAPSARSEKGHSRTPISAAASGSRYETLMLFSAVRRGRARAGGAE